MHKSLREAERALIASAQREQRAREAAAYADRDRQLAAQPDPDPAAWAALSEADRAAIERAVAKEWPRLDRAGIVFRAQCYRAMRRRQEPDA